MVVAVEVLGTAVMVAMDEVVVSAEVNMELAGVVVAVVVLVTTLVVAVVGAAMTAEDAMEPVSSEKKTHQEYTTDSLA